MAHEEDLGSKMNATYYTHIYSMKTIRCIIMIYLQCRARMDADALCSVNVEDPHFMGTPPNSSTTLQESNMATENPICIDDFAVETLIYMGFPSWSCLSTRGYLVFKPQC